MKKFYAPRGTQNPSSPGHHRTLENTRDLRSVSISSSDMALCLKRCEPCFQLLDLPHHITSWTRTRTIYRDKKGKKPTKIRTTITHSFLEYVIIKFRREKITHNDGIVGELVKMGQRHRVLVAARRVLNNVTMWHRVMSRSYSQLSVTRCQRLADLPNKKICNVRKSLRFMRSSTFCMSG